MREILFSCGFRETQTHHALQNPAKFPIRRVGRLRNKEASTGVLKLTMSKHTRVIPEGADAPWAFRVPVGLREPKTLEPMLAGIRRQQALLSKLEQKQYKPMGELATQMRTASESFQRTVAPLIEWAAKPRVRSELFMYRRSVTGDKFSKLVSAPIEALLETLLMVLDFVTPNWRADTCQKRAQIMSIRGLALSCAPNFSRKGDIKSLSRSYSGLHISLVA